MTIRGITAATAAVFLLAGCASLPNGKADPRDPWERFNRSVYKFNHAADHAVLRPAARAWKAAVPRPVRHGLSNFVSNLAYPGTIINDLMQGKFTQGGHDFTRLLINTLFGFGFFDPATAAGLERHDEDLGQTLGKWGVPPGPYLMLPLFGPSSARDAPTRLADTYTDARTYISDPYVRWGLWGTDKLEARAGLLDLDATLDRTYDPYAFIRNAWIQRREYLVRDGETADDNVDPGADAAADESDTGETAAKPPPN
jgi:phospholipid-binding lipoprotein MlaA